MLVNGFEEICHKILKEKKNNLILHHEHSDLRENWGWDQPKEKKSIHSK